MIKQAYTKTHERMNKAIEEYKLNRIVVAACSPRTHGPLFQDTMEEAGLNRYLFEMANIRNQCSWIHSQERELATKKAKDLVRMSITKASLLSPLKENEIKVKKKSLIIGGGAAGISAALSLAEIGIKVHLVERETQLGGKLKDIYTLYPSDIKADEILDELIKKVKTNENIKISTDCEIKNIDGYIGNWEVEFTDGKRTTVSTVIIATGLKRSIQQVFMNMERVGE